MDVIASSSPTLPSPGRRRLPHEQHIRHEERRRIGRELHDSTSQLLAALQLNLAALQRLSDPHGKQPLFSALDEIIQELHREVGAISTCSGEAISLHESLPAALDSMARRFAGVTDIDITTAVLGSYVDQPDKVEMSLYRIAQEALANVARHARATAVRLELDCREQSSLTLTIEDDGVGFGRSKGARRTTAGNGLANIRERVRDLGGHLTLRALSPGSSMSMTIAKSLPSNAALS